MTLNEKKLLTFSCWDEKYQPLTIGLTKNKQRCRYRSGSKSIIVANNSPF